MKGKVTQELLEKMKADRLNGLTYNEIEAKYGVSRWTTLHYLKGTVPQNTLVNQLWQKAEEKAKDYLEKKGFTHLINLNEIMPQCYFDIYAEWNKNKWLIDVTISESKDLVSKSLRIVKGYRCAVLYVNHTLENFTFVELKIIDKI